MVSFFKKKDGGNPQQDLAKKIKKEARDVKAFGGGMASNVIRFFMREKGKGGSTTFVQSKSVGKGSQQDYAFYARMNMCSAAGFAEIRDFCQRTVSHVCSSSGWRSFGGGAPAHPIIPRLLLNVESTDAALYNQMRDWIKSCHVTAKKEFNDANFASISVVEGSPADSLTDFLFFQGNLIKNMQSHALELGLIHALDVAIGMGDRLQNPNTGNVTLNPTTHQLVLIDVDSFLPPKGVHKCIEDACVFATKDMMSMLGFRDNIAWASFSTAWPPCPPRLPVQGNYMANVSAALDEDLSLYLKNLSLSESEFGKGTFKNVSPRAKSSLKVYLSWMQNTQHKDLFVRAATFALKEIKRGVNDGTLTMAVEDTTCSSARMKERVNQWKLV